MMYSDKKTPMKSVRSMNEVDANFLERSLARQDELRDCAQCVAVLAATAASGFPCSHPSRIARAFGDACGSSATAKMDCDFPPSANAISSGFSFRSRLNFNGSPGFLLRSQYSDRRGTLSPLKLLISSPASKPARSACDPGTTERTKDFPPASRSIENPSSARTISRCCNNKPAFASTDSYGSGSALATYFRKKSSN